MLLHGLFVIFVLISFARAVPLRRRGLTTNTTTTVTNLVNDVAYSTVWAGTGSRSLSRSSSQVGYNATTVTDTTFVTTTRVSTVTLSPSDAASMSAANIPQTTTIHMTSTSTIKSTVTVLPSSPVTVMSTTRSTTTVALSTMTSKIGTAASSDADNNVSGTTTTTAIFWVTQTVQPSMTPNASNGPSTLRTITSTSTRVVTITVQPSSSAVASTSAMQTVASSIGTMPLPFVPTASNAPTYSRVGNLSVPALTYPTLIPTIILTSNTWFTTTFHPHIPSTSAVAPITPASKTPGSSMVLQQSSTEARPSATPLTSSSAAPSPASTQSAPAVPAPPPPAPPTSSTPPSQPNPSTPPAGMPPANKHFTGDITHYDVGLGACGVTNTDADDIVALSLIMYDAAYTSSNPNDCPLCGKSVTIQYQDQTHQAKVVDRCTGCKYPDLDLSPSLFVKVAPNGDGRVHGVEWWFN